MIRGVLLDTEPLAAGCLVRMNKPYHQGEYSLWTATLRAIAEMAARKSRR